MLAAHRRMFRSYVRTAWTSSIRARPSRVISGAVALLSLGAGAWLVADNERPARARAHAEAAVRAARLLFTCVVIARDYKAARSWAIGHEDEDNEVRALKEEHDRWQELAGQAEAARALAQSRGSASLKEAQAEAQRTRERAMELGNQLAAMRLLRAEASGLTSRWEKLHERNAERLHALCAANGGLYVKLGQHIAQLDYIVPKAFTLSLSRLFQHTAPSSTADVLRIIEEDTGRPIHDNFAHFEPLPLASASLAQVHVALEHGTGRKLAVKVQHARLREACSSDIAAVSLAVDIAGKLFPDHFRLRWVLHELAPHLPLELDFENEAKNLRRCAAFLRESQLSSQVAVQALHNREPVLIISSQVAVPVIVPHLSSSRVLTMTFEEGCSVTDTAALHRMRLQPAAVSSLLSETFSSLIFDGGFCHCDPHPGNVLVRPRVDQPTLPQLVLLDHGLYRCALCIVQAGCGVVACIAGLNLTAESCRRCLSVFMQSFGLQSCSATLTASGG